MTNKLIKRGVSLPNESISLVNFKSGVYFLEINNQVLKIIKY